MSMAPLTLETIESRTVFDEDTLMARDGKEDRGKDIIEDFMIAAME